MSVKNSIRKMVIDEEEALDIFRSIHWSYGVYCPVCNSFEISNRGKRGRTRRYSCKDCGTFFNDFTGTPFEGSKVPFGQILWILTNIHNKSVKQMAEELGLNRKTVARYHKLIREHLLKNNIEPSFDGELEFDEMYVNAGNKGVKKKNSI
ncbi:MAG: transposase [Methanobrevibacter sp.]|jgi:transposase-like protein|nr:transposase [Candidatus Methanovirga australis]